MSHSRFEVRKEQSGFTLIELLLVIAIIAILAGVVIVAINPARQLGQADNARRQSNVLTILSAVDQYMVDNHGTTPYTITTTATEICKTGTVTSTCSPGISLAVLTDNELYMSALPIDPSINSAATGTGYSIYETTSTNPHIVVTAPHAVLGASISASH